MSDQGQAAVPAVSIILPTYNRVKFLPQAFESIRSQTFTNWELIVVDDGSTDDTAAAVEGATAALDRPVRYVRQTNQGSYGARNTGLDYARGQLVAFFDSDDVWLPHHLADCANALREHPDADWVYGASRVVELTTGRVLNPNSFYDERGRPKPFLQLRTQRRGRLRMIDDPRALRCAIRHGLGGGLQCSLLRRRLFDGYRFEAASRNETEDQLAAVLAVAAGRRLAYFDAVHLVYHVHAENSSATGAGALDRQLSVLRAMVVGYEALPRRVALTTAERRALRQRLASDCFWNVGYRQLAYPGRAADALQGMRRGLGHWPWDWRFWKVYLLARLRLALARRPSSNIP
jgi:glycosyltransferase involved in cell wall biosynthesis